MDLQPYLSHLAAQNCSAETIKAYRGDLELFAAFLAGRRLRITQVTPVVIAQYVEHMKTLPNPRFAKPGLSEASIKRRLAAVSAFFDFLRVTSNPKLRNPTRLLRRNRVHNDKPNAVDETTVTSLLEGITNARDRAIVSVFLSSGLRLTELQQLDRDAITIEEEVKPGGALVRYGFGQVLGKGSKIRTFFIDGDTIEALAIYLATRKDSLPALFISERRQRLSKRAIQDVLDAWCRKLGLQHIHPHQLRHTFATRLANANISSLVLKDLMGHSSFGTTQRYFRLKPETLARSYYAAMEFNR